MNKEKILIATYLNPDLDGVACAYAYSEYLNQIGNNSVFGLFGEYQEEVRFLVEKYEIPKFQNSSELEYEENPIIIVDASDLRGLSKNINPKKIIEVIDHRKYFQREAFPNAKFQIELVGAAATLIAEKIYASKTTISEYSAILLYYAIISNTINFKANVTTNRDIEMSNWLGDKIGASKEIINQMFEFKTQNLEVSKKSFLDSYAAFFEFEGKKIGIVQLEIIRANEFFNSHIIECKEILKEIKAEYELDGIFITSIDLIEGKNYFQTIDNFSQSLLQDSVSAKFENDLGIREGVLMRKEIVPRIKEKIKKTTQNNASIP